MTGCGSAVGLVTNRCHASREVSAGIASRQCGDILAASQADGTAATHVEYADGRSTCSDCIHAFKVSIDSLILVRPKLLQKLLSRGTMCAASMQLIYRDIEIVNGVQLRAGAHKPTQPLMLDSTSSCATSISLMVAFMLALPRVFVGHYGPKQVSSSIANNHANSTAAPLGN